MQNNIEIQTTKSFSIPLIKVIGALLSVSIVLSVFTDFPLQATFLGYLGSSPTFIPLIILIFVFLLSLRIWKKINIRFLGFILYVALGFSYGILIFGASFYDENLIFKGIKTLFLYTLFLLPIFVFRNTLSVRTAFGVAFFVSLAGIVLNNLSIISYFHFTESLNMRNRGFALESSHLSVILMTTFPVFFYNARSKLFKIILLGLFILSFVFSDSKGGLGSLFIAIIILSLLLLFKNLINSRFERRSFLYSGLSIAVIIIAIGSYQIIDATVKNNVELYTSFPTRISGAITSIYILAKNPLGVGTSGFLPAFIEQLPYGIRATQLFFPDFTNYNEVESYTYQTSDENISTKSFFFDGIISFGILFVLVYVSFFFFVVAKLVSRSEYFLALFTINLFIAFILYTGSLNLYSSTFFLGFVYSKVIRKIN